MESSKKMKEEVGQKLARIMSHFRLLEDKFKELFEVNSFKLLIKIIVLSLRLAYIPCVTKQ